jgi:dihydrodipicolinate synthase/N-acetylneuraminate lyase
MRWQDIPAETLAVFRSGTVIPAHPLALDAGRRLDERRQRALARYYIDAGAGGLAVGVHTTQFAIRDVGLYRPVLELAAETARSWTTRPLFLVAGVAGRSAQAVAEARVARALGYHAVLVSLAAFRDATEDAMLAHCRALADELPVVGFYLQPAVGGVVLSRAFWEHFAAIENVVGIKVAPFDRYRTLDVIHGVAAAGAQERISLYTGNDDHIVLDLTVPFRTEAGELRFVGGLLGHWSVWTRTAVEILERCRGARDLAAVPADLLALDSAVTDCNAAFFDVPNAFHGVIAGCHEVLRRQGLLAGRWCLDPEEDLSPGQAEEIDRVYRSYPELSDDEFVAANLERWLEPA